MTAPVPAGPVVVSPLSPAKIAVNDPASILTGVVTALATAASVWPGQAGLQLPAGMPKTLDLMAAALMVTLIFSKHLLSAAAVTAAATPSPVTQADLAAHATAQQQALARLQEALSETLSALQAPPGAPYPPPAGVPITGVAIKPPAGP